MCEKSGRAVIRSDLNPDRLGLQRRRELPLRQVRSFLQRDLLVITPVSVADLKGKAAATIAELGAGFRRSRRCFTRDSQFRKRQPISQRLVVITIGGDKAPLSQANQNRRAW